MLLYQPIDFQVVNGHVNHDDVGKHFTFVR